MGYAFISYCTKNQTSADAMRELFNRHNIDTWMAPYDIPAGSKYAAVITKAIRECGCFVLLLSNDSQASEAVDSEVELAALTFKKSIITVELEKVILNDSFTFYIHNKQIIAVHNIDENSHEVKQVLDAVRAYTKEYADTEVPTVLQNDATECGAAALAMICAYYGKPVSLEQMKVEVGVTNMGCSAGDIMRAAKRFGFECHGYRKSVQDLLKIELHCILHWNNNHFVVLEGIDRKKVYINDPAMGHRAITAAEFATLFSGVVLTFKPATDGGAEQPSQNQPPASLPVNKNTGNDAAEDPRMMQEYRQRLVDFLKRTVW